MKHKILALLFILFACVKVFAQDFYGFVKKADSTSSPVYQANVEITENYKPFKTLKTYFDGAFKFTPGKDQLYTIKISYNGYKDTAYTITTDKKGTLSAQNVTVKLKKDGMRLLGVIKSADESFPIKDATIILKNVMTRQEDRLTTDIDGKYNFKLEYETNYKVSIDKRSVGVFNKYKDTTFYVSTIGFNQPLDYKLDIILDAMLYPSTTIREGYDATKPVSANVKPVIEVANNSAMEKQPFVAEDKKLKSAQDANAKLLAELEKAKKEIEELKHKETEHKKFVAGGISAAKKPKAKENPNLEVVVIRDEPVVNKNQVDTSLAKITKQKEEAEKKAQQIEAEIARQKAEEQKRLKEAAIKAREDSIAKVKEENELRAIAVALQKQKLKDDSIAQAKARLERIAQEIAAKKLKEDSVAIVKAELAKAAKELALKKAQEDSVQKAIAIARAKFVQDSIAKVKAELLAIEKAKQDSFVRAKAEQERIAKELAIKKAQEDSVNKAIATARAKFVQDSIAKVKAELLAIEKAKQDSFVRAKAEQERIAKELVLKKIKEDSIIKVTVAARVKFIQDSLNYARELQAQRKKDEEALKKREAAEKQAALDAELAVKKAILDSINKEIVTARAVFVQDSLLKVKVELAAKEKAKQDSISRVKAEQERIAKEFALKKAQEDSMQKAIATARTKFVQDSIVKVKAELAERERAEKERIARKLALKKAFEDSITKMQAYVRKKYTEDSLAQVKADRERAAKEIVERKAYEDSVSKALMLSAAKVFQDSMLKVKAYNEKIAREMAERKKQEEEMKQAIAKARQDSIATANGEREKKALAESLAKAKAELDRMAAELAEAKRKAHEDSVAKVQAETKAAKDLAEKKRIAEVLAADKSASEDSLTRIQLEKERMAKELTELKQKEAQDKREKEIAETERRIHEESLRKQSEAAAKRLAEQKAIGEERKRQDSIAKVQTELLVKEKAEADARVQAELQRKKEQENNRSEELIKTERNNLPITSKEIANSLLPANDTQTEYGILPAVFFNKNEFVLSADAKAALKPVAQMLVRQLELIVSVYAFASPDEDDSRQVSLRRSDVVLRFFIDNGVPIERIKSVYYGTSFSRNGCVTLDCPEELQKQNRSVAYKVGIQ